MILLFKGSDLRYPRRLDFHSPLFVRSLAVSHLHKFHTLRQFATSIVNNVQKVRNEKYTDYLLLTESIDSLTYYCMGADGNIHLYQGTLQPL